MTSDRSTRSVRPRRGRIPSVVRVLTDGSVVEAASESLSMRRSTPRPRPDRGPRSGEPIRGAKRTFRSSSSSRECTITGSAVATNGDADHDVVAYRRHGAPRRQTETPLPAPASPKPNEAVQHWPSFWQYACGRRIRRPWRWATGSLFHFEMGKWSEVELPEPPFATVGNTRRRRSSCAPAGDLMPTRDMLKRVRWKTPERYRAVLRQKWPREVPSSATSRCPSSGT